MKLKHLLLPITMICAVAVYSQNHPNFVDFEDGNQGGQSHTHVTNSTNWENTDVDNAYFDAVYHVQFFNDFYSAGYSQTDIPKYALIGDDGTSTNERVAFANTSTTVDAACSSLSNSPSDDDNPYNNPYSNMDPGCWFLTDDDGIVTQNPQDLIIEYDETSIQCTIASGYIYDLDAGSTIAEGWQIDIYSTSSSPTSPDNTIFLLSNNWTNCQNFGGCPSTPLAGAAYNNIALATDGSATYWEIQTNGDPIDYIVMSYIGDPARGVGVAFDNFYYCSADSSNNGSNDCDLAVDFNATNMGCGVQFTDLSTATTHTIVGWHWDFGDGNTSDEQNPYHYYGTSGAYTVTLTVTSYNGEECCTETIEREIFVEECLPCEADIDFSYAPIFRECENCYMEFNALVYYHTTPILGYYWTIDGVVYTGETVQAMINGGATVCLTIVFASGEDGDLGCCTRTICTTVECEMEGLASQNPTAGRASSDDGDDGQVQNADELGSAISANLKVFPNPGNELLNFEFEVANSEMVSIELISTDGSIHKLQAGENVAAGQQRMTFDVSNLAEGIYMARITIGSESIVKTVSITH